MIFDDMIKFSLQLHLFSFQALVPQPAVCIFTQNNEERKVCFVLLSAWSLANKNFLLNVFFSSHDLDFFSLLDKRIQDNESAQFSELPPHCLYFSSTWNTGPGGGLVSVSKSSFKRQPCLLSSFSSFEISVIYYFYVPILLPLLYRSPQFNKDFIQDLTDFLTSLIVNYNWFLILEDFNIYVCYESGALVKDFLNCIVSFNLMQSVSGPTHENVHAGPCAVLWANVKCQ